MCDRSPNATKPGINLLIYPSTLLSSGRLMKLSRSLQDSGEFASTHLVGIGDAESKEEVSEDTDVFISRVPGANIRGKFGGIRIMLFWPFRVYRRYQHEKITAVAAQNVYLLPLAYRLAKKTNAIFVYNAHELETETIGAKGFKQKIAKIIERRYINKVDVFSVVNESIAEWYRNAYEGINPVVVTNTPIDHGGIVEIKPALGIPKKEILYIHVGFLMEGRNIPLLLEEFAKRPQLHLAFLGDGYLRQLVKDAAEKFQNIHVLETVQPDEVVSVVRGADIGFCLIEEVSLSDKLSTPNKLMESLAAGIPPLCSDLPEARRLLGKKMSDKWVLKSPAEELGTYLDKLSQADVSEFKAGWKGIPSWDSQVINLVTEYKEAIAHKVSQK